MIKSRNRKRWYLTRILLKRINEIAGWKRWKAVKEKSWFGSSAIFFPSSRIVYDKNGELHSGPPTFGVLNVFQARQAEIISQINLIMCNAWKCIDDNSIEIHQQQRNIRISWFYLLSISIPTWIHRDFYSDNILIDPKSIRSERNSTKKRPFHWSVQRFRRYLKMVLFSGFYQSKPIANEYTIFWSRIYTFMTILLCLDVRYNFHFERA